MTARRVVGPSGRTAFALLLYIVLSILPALAQQPAPSPPGRVIASTGHPPQPTPNVLPKIPVTNTERSALVFAAYDLDVHLEPANAHEEVHAIVTLRNVSGASLRRIPLQISGSLHWLSVAALAGQKVTPLAFTQSPIATDADHTGYAQEAILIPSEPLAPGNSLRLSLVYSGSIEASAARLELIGTPLHRAAQQDWDAIAPTTDQGATALRGFGNVLWYPVAAPTAAFGDGNKLFQLIAQQRLRNASTSMRLRLSVSYLGDPPDSAIFNGHMQPLARISDTDDQAIEQTQGTASADFPLAPIGFRNPSLFLTAQHPAASEGQLLSIVSPHAEVNQTYAAAAASVRPMLTEWLGQNPRTPLLLLDHAGEPFEEDAFLAAPLNATASTDITAKPEEIAPTLVRGLTHAWLHAPAASSIWINEGFAEFMHLLWTERTRGREAVLAELQQNALLIALAEPNLVANPSNKGQPLTEASADVFVRLKAAAVFWQLREILGDESFRQAMIAFRHSLALTPNFDNEPNAFQKSLERTTQRDLAWFFNDWVYRDPGLPDLSITQINPRPLPARPGKNSGYLVAVEIRNEGEAVAEVPVSVRSGTLTSMERVRVPAHASASTRILFEEIPQTIQLNDGSVPEQLTSVHSGNVTVLH